MSMISEIVALGADYNDAMGRFMNKESFYERMLKKFPKSIDDNPVMPLLEAGQYEEAIAPAHTLKGVTGNLSLTPLYTAYTQVVADLRAKNYEQAVAEYKALLPLQAQFRKAIEEN